jgi:hypothetical protein
MYLTLRDQDVSRGQALLGTACLGAYPIYFLLAFRRSAQTSASPRCGGARDGPDRPAALGAAAEVRHRVGASPLAMIDTTLG